ncbi:Mis12-Mtw1 protein family-domain-containing protein [Lipomyces oligophaga]|uniref:Mis12-Mtw1 protein family-domain-containing protein n=1 Tax=Lipomyces oligophaga TaxID=45792 RepID=UPI0034CFB89B
MPSRHAPIATIPAPGIIIPSISARRGLERRMPPLQKLSARSSKRRTRERDLEDPFEEHIVKPKEPGPVKRRRAAAVAAESKILESSRTTRKPRRSSSIAVGAQEEDDGFMFTRIRNLPTPSPIQEKPLVPTQAIHIANIPNKQEQDLTTDSHTTTISLPLTDTPMIRRNQQLRQHGNSRRSSLGMRGKRASSISSGLVAVPHSDIPVEDFYKHLDADLSDPHRMKQLLTWCGQRSLDEMKQKDQQSKNTNSKTILSPAADIARTIQEELLKDITAGRISVSWWGRPDEDEVLTKPNPQNIANKAKVDEFKERLESLKVEKLAWEEMERSGPSISTRTTDMDVSLLLPKEASFLSHEASKELSEVDEAKKLKALELRLNDVEVDVDTVRHSVNQIRGLSMASEKYADNIIKRATGALASGEAEAQRQAGTDKLDIREVLRSLSKAEQS